MESKHAWYGWRPDVPDHRDYAFKAPVTKLPQSVDLRKWAGPFPKVMDQGPLGSCTANAIATAHQWAQIRQTGKGFRPSRLFIYYNEREIEGSVNEDSGAYIRDGLKSVAKQGVCAETKWPYIIQKFARKPSYANYQDALLHQGLVYRRVSPVLFEMKSCLAQGYPFVFGFSVYESFESEEVAIKGIVPMPSKYESFLGGHAVLAIGYNSTHFLVRNSWGLDWGLGGYFKMPYAYLTDSNLSDDFWMIEKVEV